MGIGGALGIAFGAVGAAAQRNAEIAGALAGINGDLWGGAVDSAIESTESADAR